MYLSSPHQKDKSCNSCFNKENLIWEIKQVLENGLRRQEVDYEVIHKLFGFSGFFFMREFMSLFCIFSDYWKDFATSRNDI